MSTATISRITGTLVEAKPLPRAGLYELAHVGDRRLLAEVIRVSGETGTLQVYEETAGLRVGEPVVLSRRALAVTLGPGLLGGILDGLGRPLDVMAETGGAFIAPGTSAETLDPARRWSFTAALKPGEPVAGGDVLGEIEERPGFSHRVMVPPGTAGKLAELRSGEFTVSDVIGRMEDGTELRLAHAWPVREPRPVGRGLPDNRPLITGQRVFDLLFPVAEGGTIGVPGGFGTGKTIIEQSLAKFADADVVVYIGCGERGNEMSEVLNEFPRLQDPRTGRSIMDRTVMVVNTSNMPVAAREASVYLGITIAEYYRDMGYRVAVMADSLSRWAEALREISARLQEMPGEEGYPTYLANRLGKFYERAGRARQAGRPERDGALTLISAISPPGGDFSEPVTQASLRVVGGLWALDPALAHQRQFPAVDWETSYSLYVESTAAWFAGEAGADWPELRTRALALLQRGRELRDISSLVGPVALQDTDRLVLESAAILRDVVLGQSAYSPADAFSPLKKTWQLARLALALHQAADSAIRNGAAFARLDLAGARRALLAVREAAADAMDGRVAEADGLIAELAGQKGETT
ncbi:MAG: V-type ATP synthase subunit A [Gemmatimonadales bacterium]